MMADQEHIKYLHNTSLWNYWRAEHPDMHPNLRGIHLYNVPLSISTLNHWRDADFHWRGADIVSADLFDANLSYCDLREAHFMDSFLSGIDLMGADLDYANLDGATLFSARLNKAHLTNASLRHTSLRNANLSYANLNYADLSYADLSGANLNYADLSYAIMEMTMLGECNLRNVKGLKTITHKGPSHLSINSIYLSEGSIPEAFVRGTGAPETFIEYMHSLVTRPIDYYTCFISYSSKDESFARRLYADLQQEGVRCWYAPEDLKIGDKFRQRIDESIRIHDKLLLVLSEHSVKSPWVEKEVETAFEREHTQGQLVLFPVKLDDTVMQASQAWAAAIRRMRHIGDFTTWKDHDAYQKAFTRLLRDLQSEKDNGS